MKKFETPELEIQFFEVMDVITTSTDSDLGDLELPVIDSDMGNWG